jgi:regulator of nucleoside diphosphate kinase
MSSLPAIYITRSDYDRLSGIVPDHETLAAGPALLSRELDRAHLVSPGSKRRFVRLGSLVTYEDLRTGRARTVRLALPEQADIDQGIISVLSPVGAALLGLPEGRVFEWRDREGRPHALRVLTTG